MGVLPAIPGAAERLSATPVPEPPLVVRSKLQEQGQVRKASIGESVKCSREGIPGGFYRGCAANLLRTTPSAVITLTSYEMSHRFLLELVLSRQGYRNTCKSETRGNPEIRNRDVGERQRDLGLRESQTQSGKARRPMSFRHEREMGNKHIPPSF